VQEPIRFFDQMVLFQDELSDNGDCIESVKVRAMPSGFFCLHRMFLRVDDVVCTIRDTRLYHAFGSPVLLHEWQVRSNPLSDLKKITDPSKFADDNFMWEQLTPRTLVTKSINLQ
jgi:type 2A phosphatase activator TIP41